MIYLWLKALHVACVIIYAGGMLLLAIAPVLRRATSATAADLPALKALARWNRRVTSPAMAGVWVFGIALAYLGEWYMEPWFLAKFAVVFALSGLHGALTGRLRRMCGDPAHMPPAALVTIAGPITLAAIIIVALLVVLKPFG